MAGGGQDDPWARVEDLDGRALYRTLQLPPSASTQDVKKAYRSLARALHPDKGGSAAAFARLQAAYDTLGDPQRRAVYDAWGSNLQFKYVRTASSQGAGGEEALFRELSRSGVVCNPATQLLLTCELCGRPADKTCWTCSAPLCSFCTMKRHWRGAYPLHWPLVNAPGSVSERIAKRELEAKKVEDAQRAAAQDPDARSPQELAVARQFMEAAAAAALQSAGRHARATPHATTARSSSASTNVGGDPDSCTSDGTRGTGGSCDGSGVCRAMALDRFFMWAQTESLVLLAVHVPTGAARRALLAEVGGPSGRQLTLIAEGSAPVLCRTLTHGVDTSHGLEVLRTADGRYAAAVLLKATPGEAWRACFAGDSDGHRCLVPPYHLAEGPDSVLLELGLPFYTHNEDVCVAFHGGRLAVDTRAGLCLRRTYATRRWDAGGRAPDEQPHAVVDEAACRWWLSEDASGSNSNSVAAGGDGGGAAGRGGRRHGKALCIHLEKTAQEVERGAKAARRGASGTGVAVPAAACRFFEEDGDEFGLEALLQALCFLEEGRAYVPSAGRGGGWATRLHDLPQPAQRHVGTFAEQQGHVEGVDGGAAQPVHEHAVAQHAASTVAASAAAAVAN